MHSTSNGLHETERNQQVLNLLNTLLPAHTILELAKPRLYPSAADLDFVSKYKIEKYICLAPTSVWFTKQYPGEKWREFLALIPDEYKIYLLGAASDFDICEAIKKGLNKNIENLCGKLSLLQSAALLQGAAMNYVNDSAPMHLCSAMNAPTAAIFCSTIPAFGFGPLANKSIIIEKKEPLYCRPCGLHGYKACPEGHFKCAYDIETTDLLKVLNT